MPALFFLGDFDGNDRLDIAAVSSVGTLQLLSNAGAGRFEDVTEQVGLSAARNVALALWADYDGDGRLDLFVGARKGASQLFHNEQGAFVEMTEGSGLVIEGAVESAQWLDLDGDGRLDLFVVTSEKTELFRGLEGGFFEPAELPLAGTANVAEWGAPGSPDDVDIDGPRAAFASPSSGKDSARPGGLTGGIVNPGGLSHSGGVSGLPLAPLSFSCVPSIRNQTPGPACIKAATTPGVVGRLYPLTSNLFVAVSGNVGINTTSPAARLDINGTTLLGGVATISSGQRVQAAIAGGARILGEQGNTATTPAIGFFSTNGVDDGGGGNGIYRPLANTMAFATASTERMRITSAGNVGIGRTPTANRLEVEGDASKTAAGDWLANSDRRIKTEIRPVEDALDTLERLRPVVFRYTKEYRDQHPSIEDKQYYNVVAQEFAEVFPEYVKPSGEGDILQVDTYPMQVCAIAAVKELHVLLLERDGRIAELESRLQEESDRIAVLESVEARLQNLEATLAVLARSK